VKGVAGGGAFADCGIEVGDAKRESNSKEEKYNILNGLQAI